MECHLFPRCCQPESWRPLDPTVSLNPHGEEVRVRTTRTQYVQPRAVSNHEGPGYGLNPARRIAFRDAPQHEGATRMTQ